MEGEYLHVFLSLFGILGLMGLLFYVSKKMNLIKVKSNKSIKLIDSLSLGGKEKIVVAEINHVVLVLGITPNHINTLHMFPHAAITDTKQNEKANQFFEFSDFINTVTKKNKMEVN